MEVVTKNVNFDIVCGRLKQELFLQPSGDSMSDSKNLPKRIIIEITVYGDFCGDTKTGPNTYKITVPLNWDEPEIELMSGDAPTEVTVGLRNILEEDEIDNGENFY
jgi:hypothetical protein